MDDDSDLKSLCRRWRDALNIVTVTSETSFEIPKARNLTLRAALGDICLQMDADTLLHRTALETLWEKAAEGEACLLGQVLGYGNNEDGDVDMVETAKFAAHKARLESLIGGQTDMRLGDPINIAWAFVWTGFAALPMRAVRAHNLYFDETFCGWGVDDLEWGKRIAGAGLPIGLCENLYALHLPHSRSVASNKASETLNFRRLLRKHPERDVELVAAFNDIDANKLYLSYSDELSQIEHRTRSSLHCHIGIVGGRRVLIVAAASGPDQRTDIVPNFRGEKRLPYVGLALPYEDNAFDQVIVSPAAREFSPRFRDRILAEAQRLSLTPVGCTAGSQPNTLFESPDSQTV